MRIRLSRSGGIVAAPGLTAEVDLRMADLPPEVADELAVLVEAVVGPGMPPLVEGHPGAADHYEYSLTIETNEDVRTIWVSEAATDERIANLVAWLERYRAQHSPDQ